MSLIIRQSYPTTSAPAPPPALALDNSSQGGALSATSATVSHQVVAASGYALLRVVVSIIDPASLADPQVTGITYNGSPLTFLPGSQVYDNGGRKQETWYLKNPASGTHNIVVSTDIAANINVAADSWDGVNQTAPFGTPGTNSAASGTNATAVAAGVSAGNFTLGSLTVFGGTATTSGAPQGHNASLISVISGASPNRYRLQTSSNDFDTGSVTVQWTLGASKPWTAVAVELKKA